VSGAAWWGLIQATIGEIPGRISLEAEPGNYFMFNMSLMQRLGQTRAERSFENDVLQRLEAWGPKRDLLISECRWE
jgi:hypothetical protein